MKKLFFLILILASNLFAQGWNDIVTTEIEEPDKTDIFTNSSAIHILIRTLGGDIVYYNLNSAGDIDEDKTDTLETSGYFPNIIGTNDKIYAIYKTGNNIRVKYSTDNGSSWLTNIADRPTTENDCNGVDAVYEEGLSGGVHLVWATQDGGTSGFETYYYRLNTNHSWVDPQTITNVSEAQYGGNPSITVSPNRVHVSFNTDTTTYNYGTGDVITRDKDNGNWQTPQTVVTGSSEQSVDERLLVRGAYLYLFYSRDHSLGPHDLRFRTRSVDNTTGWSDSTTLESVTLYQYEDAFEIAKTTNDYIHILCKKHLGSPIGWAYTYKYYDGTNWSTEDTIDHPSMGLRQIGLSSVSNDLFCTWVKYETPTKYMRFRQYDALPLTPTNFAGTIYSNHPKLTWDKIEPDIAHFEIWQQFIYHVKHPGSWNLLTTTTNTSFVDNGIQLGGNPIGWVNYKVRSKDMSDNYSPYTTGVGFVFGGGINKTAGEHKSFEYSLSSNYPNPFNPSTQIKYSLAQDADVTLKVYDMLGTEVAKLVNETQTAGNHTFSFNAKDLSSGVYIYRITATNNGRILFTDSKQMILLR